MFSRDPGGTNAVMQLIEPLRTQGNEVTVYAKDAALSIYRKLKMECTDIRDAIPSGTREETSEFVRKLNPDLIVTGTSSEDFTERHLWKAAEKRVLRVLPCLTNGRIIAYVSFRKGEIRERGRR